MRGQPRIQRDADGTLDDFHVTNVKTLHFEAIDQSRWYATVILDSGEEWQLDFGAQNANAKGYARAEQIDP